MLENVDHGQISGRSNTVGQPELAGTKGWAGIFDLRRDHAGLAVEEGMGSFD
jgi:hypothetical protein